jgi:hypothetical protein
MERRTFLGAAAILALVSGTANSAPVTKGADADAIMRMLIEWYRAFGNPRVDRDYYRSFMTDDYLLLENGELLDLAGDIAMLASLAPDHVRTDRFDFRYIRVDGDNAYAVYFLESDMNDSKLGPRSRRWLESAILRRVDGRWRAAVLHSTRINAPSS